MPGDVAYTCETAGHFFLYQVFARWEEFVGKVKPLVNEVCCLIIYLYITVSQSMNIIIIQEGGVSLIAKEFPFNKYFSNAPQPVFKGVSFLEDWDIAEVSWGHVQYCI